MTLITPRTSEVRIYHGDDLQQLADLRRDLDVAQRAAALQVATLGGDDTVATARAAYDAAVDAAAARAVTVKLKALGVRAFRQLRAEHPARTSVGDDGRPVTHPDDEDYGVNVETFPWAFLPAAIVEPDLGKAAAEEFLDSLADGDFEKLWLTAYFLNVSPGSDPKDEQRYASTLT